MESRKALLERKINEAQAKLADIEKQLGSAVKLLKQRDRLMVRIEHLSKELGSLDVSTLE